LSLERLMSSLTMHSFTDDNSLHEIFTRKLTTREEKRKRAE
jgi:hypothetical protein